MKFLIVPISGEKRTTVDHYNTGCALETYGAWEYDANELPTPATKLADIFSEFVGDTVKGSNIALFDPNVYCDTLSGNTRTVEANDARGIYRAIFDRMETEDGEVPNADTLARFERGEIPLFHADYELYFQLRAVLDSEADLAKLLGVQDSEWSRPASDFTTEAPTE